MCSISKYLLYILVSIKILTHSAFYNAFKLTLLLMHRTPFSSISNITHDRPYKLCTLL